MTACLVCQTGILGGLGPLAVHGQSPQVHLVVQQGLGVVTVGELDHHHLLVDGVEVVQAPVHHSDGGRLVDGGALLQDGSSVSSVTVY